MRAWSLTLLLGLSLLPVGAAARNSLVTSLPGVGADEAAALAAAGVEDTRRLYQRTHEGARKIGRLARRSGLPQERIRHLATLADLCRLYRMTPRIALLLARAGVGSMKELSRQDAAELAATMTTINAAERVTDFPPTERMLAGWIRDARRTKPEVWEQLKAWTNVR